MKKPTQSAGADERAQFFLLLLRVVVFSTDARVEFFQRQNRLLSEANDRLSREVELLRGGARAVA